MKRTGSLLSLAAAALAAGCAQTETANIPSDALITNESFVAIARDGSNAAKAQQAGAIGVSAQGSNDFYIAISKKELGSKWFLTGFLRQYYPGTGTPADLAVRTLGTRVVSFSVQNGKLFMFDAADGHATSDVFDPQILVEAYPIVTNYGAFNALPNHDAYVLFDPAAGLNKFQVASNLYTDSYLTSDGGNADFAVGLAYMQNFQRISDGVTFEEVFTGQGRVDLGDGHPAVYATAGTVSMGLRKYKESPNFASTPLPQTGDFFFMSDFQLVPGGATASAVHFPISRDMPKPITFLITKDIMQFDRQYPNAHILDAVKEGIENWNDVFGFQALKADLAGDDDLIGQVDKNFIIVDPDPSAGYAFANWRSNPNTGETLGATVYLGGVWFASNPFADNTAATSGSSDNLTARVLPAPKPKMVSLAWTPMKTEPGCVFWAPKYRSSWKPADATAPTSGGDLTPDQKFHNFIVHVVLHEVGHTLGLRHNFKGSLLPPSSSVMDYLTNDDSVERSHPGDYDVAAINYLYGLTKDEPKQPFCTDDAVSSDPECAMFDSGADPYHDYHAPYLDHLIQLEFKYGWGNNAILDQVFNYYLNDSMGFAVAAPTPEVAVEAYSRALGKDYEATSAATASQYFAATVDGIWHTVLARLYLDPAGSRGYISALPSYPDVNATAVRDLGSVLTNDASDFTFDTRRAAVDILKLMQSEDAYAELRAARDAIDATKGTLSTQEQALVDDLLARIDRATTPYFDH